MHTALLIKVEDWEVFYVDQKMVDEGHHLGIEFIVDYVIGHNIRAFRRHSPNDDTPSADEPLFRYWDDSGWWNFPKRLDDDIWSEVIGL